MKSELSSLGISVFLHSTCFTKASSDKTKSLIRTGNFVPNLSTGAEAGIHWSRELGTGNHKGIYEQY